MGIGRARVSQLSATRPDFWGLIPCRWFIYTGARRELGGRACGGSEHRCVQGVRNSYVLHRTVYILIFYTCVYSGRSQVCVGRQKVSCLIPDGVYSDTLHMCIFWASTGVCRASESLMCYTGRCVFRHSKHVYILILYGVYYETLHMCIFCVYILSLHTSTSDMFYCIWDMKLSTCVYSDTVWCVLSTTHLPQMCFIAYGI